MTAVYETLGLPAPAPESERLFERARRTVPGGVNSPVRAFRAVGGTPRFMVSGKGAYLTDADGREYVDLICSWGPMILGHAHPAVRTTRPSRTVAAASRLGPGSVGDGDRHHPDTI